MKLIEINRKMYPEECNDCSVENSQAKIDRAIRSHPSYFSLLIRQYQMYFYLMF